MTVYAVNKTILRSGTNAHTLAPGLSGGNVKVIVDTYEASALSSGEVIQMGGTLPTGARVLAVLLAYDAMGASVTMDVGDAEDVDRYLDGIDVSSAGSTISNLVDGVEYEVDMTTASTPDNQILITIGGAAATGTVKLVIFYTHE